MAEPLPDLWVIFDSQGYYRTDETENSARLFCERYNDREGDDPLKPYTYQRYVAAGVAVPRGGEKG